MNIAVFIKSTTFHKNHGGMEVQNKMICEELRRRGHKVFVFSPKGSIQENDIEQNGVKYIFIKSAYNKYIFYLINPDSWYKKSLAVFSRINDSENFHLVLSQSASGESIVEKKNSFGVKIVSIAHGTASSEFLTFIKNISNIKDIYWMIRNTQYFIRQYFGRQRRYILHSDKVIAVSDYVKKSLVSETFVSENKVEVIHNGIEGSLYRPSNIKKETGILDLYFIGRIEKSKGILTILDILKDIKKDFIFHVVGDGPYLLEAKRRAKKNGIENKVVFHGRMSHRDFISKINPDIFVFPTKRIEGFPMVLVESMFARIPVVAFDCGGVSDAVENEKTGFLIKSGDNLMFRKCLEKLMGNKDLRLEMGRNSKEKAEKEFTIGRMIDSYEKIFKEVLK